MEGLVHNLNTMHSRGGNQVVFSSINYGTDTSPEGRMVIRELLSATTEGLGHGEGTGLPDTDFQGEGGHLVQRCRLCRGDGRLRGGDGRKLRFQAPNFDLLLEACRTTSTALFPNFLFLDTDYNRNELWRADDPDRFRYEVATMGCRTRVFENLHGVKSSWGRGQPLVHLDEYASAGHRGPARSRGAAPRRRQACPFVGEARMLFLEKVRSIAALIAEQLHERYEYQRKALARQFPFMMGNDVWKGGGRLDPNEEGGRCYRQRDSGHRLYRWSQCHVRHLRRGACPQR